MAAANPQPVQTTEEGANKRRKISGESDGNENVPLAACVKDSEYYFKDGSICLRAANTLFRVYQGNLARHSDVFRTLFDLPRPQGEAQSSEDSLENIPVVHLQDDPSNVRALLTAMHNPL